MRRTLARMLCLVALAAPAWALAVPSADQLDAVLELGADRPDDALAAIDGLHASDARTQRVLLVARGLVDAVNGREANAIERINDLHKHDGDPLAWAGAELVQATLAQVLGRYDAAAAHGAAALKAYADCVAAASIVDCDADAHWRTLRVLYVNAVQQGNRVQARVHMEHALEVARSAGAVAHQAESHAALASLSAWLGEFERALRQLAQAEDLAERLADGRLRARVQAHAARVAGGRGDRAMALAAWEQAVVLAERAGAALLTAQYRTNLSHMYLRAGRPRDALQQVALAQPTLRRHRQVHAERVLLHNAGLAHIALGRVAEGRRTLERLLELWGPAGDRAVALREFGEALAAAGDVRGALDLYHRERAVAAEIEAANRDSAVRELRARYDREAQQRDIELLERDGALKSAQLANDALLLRMWALAAVLVVLAVSVSVLLYRRVHETQRALVHSNALLRARSRRDPLTGLANRRHLQEVMRAAGHDAFDGALLLIDLDHFKRVNDEHGHAAGDQVLVAVARRLADAVRDDDLVVRWGGEEFLVFAPRLGAAQLDRLAERLLRAVGGEPVELGGQALAITASVGYARFPLPPGEVALSFEQAANFADMALYTAKSLGRNRAVGIAAAQAGDASALAAIEDDFERAWADGRVTLRVAPGPGATVADSDVMPMPAV